MKSFSKAKTHESGVSILNQTFGAAQPSFGSEASWFDSRRIVLVAVGITYCEINYQDNVTTPSKDLRGKKIATRGSREKRHAQT